MAVDDLPEQELAKAAIPILMQERKQLLHDLSFHLDKGIDYGVLGNLLTVSSAISIVESIAQGKPKDPYADRGLIGFDEPHS